MTEKCVLSSKDVLLRAVGWLSEPAGESRASTRDLIERLARELKDTRAGLVACNHMFFRTHRRTGSESMPLAKDYAIEHAEYLATAAEDLMSASEQVDANVEYASQNSIDRHSAAWRALRTRIYEFRKCAERARTSVETECQHDLLKPNTTIKIIDPWKAKCTACYEFFDISGGDPHHPKLLKNGEGKQT